MLNSPWPESTPLSEPVTVTQAWNVDPNAQVVILADNSVPDTYPDGLSSLISPLTHDTIYPACAGPGPCRLLYGLPIDFDSAGVGPSYSVVPQVNAAATAPVQPPSTVNPDPIIIDNLNAPQVKPRPRRATPHVGSEKSKRTCPTCGKLFTRGYNMTSHWKEVHDPNNPRFSCHHCPRSYKRKNDLKRHVEKNHHLP